MYYSKLFLVLFALMVSCKPTKKQDHNEQDTTFNYLALGDSYTIGESVCDSCNFPNQLALELKNNTNKAIDVNIIARTGWTTTQLLGAVSSAQLETNHDLVTLLIGVNNEYQNLAFNTYKIEFPILVNKAIALAHADSTKVTVLSIPDYAFTPFGQSKINNSEISKRLERYNTYAEAVCKSKNVRFVNITDITQLGLQNPNLVANDGLHPSTEAYTEFVKRLLPLILNKIN